tara:strand:- start:20754 stop:23750 length:2997 start_codon:yes stop_codon:yes gene_type:complete
MTQYRFSLAEALLIILLFSSYSFQPSDNVKNWGDETEESQEKRGFWNAPSAQADSIFDAMSLDEKIGQLFMVAAYTNKNADHIAEIERLISKENIGGLIFFQNNAEKQIQLTNQYQALSKTPLMIGIDGEWGLSMRLKNTPEFPRQMALGAIKDSTLIYNMGAEIAEHCKRLGIHVNFAPVIDVNVNPKNPVINYRSFGEDKKNVATKAWQYAKGMEDNGVMSCVKHFPGHGDTDSDSHKSLPTIAHNLKRLNDVEFYPFHQLFDKGVGSVMVAHLNIPALKTDGKASTLSRYIVTDLLRDTFNFEGLAFTDALNMKGVSAYYAPGDVDLMALKAGNDVLLFPEDVPKAKAKIKAAIENGELSEEELNLHVKRILQAKAYYGVLDFKPLNETYSSSELYNAKYYEIADKLYQASIAVVKNQDNTLPLELNQEKRAVLYINRVNNVFQDEIAKYGSAEKFLLTSSTTEEEKYRLYYQLNQFEEIIVHYGMTSNSPSKRFGFTEKSAVFIEKLAQKNKTIFIWNGNPYGLKYLKSPAIYSAIVCGNTESKMQQEVLAQALVGTRTLNGKLPISTGTFKVGTGVEIKKARNLLNSVKPEQVGVNSYKLAKVDSLVQVGIDKMAMPGCQIFVSRKGKVVLNKSYGSFTYDKKRLVKNDDLYDLASLTKILASTISIMRLYDEGKIDLDAGLGDYLKWIPKDSQYHNVIIRDALMHQAGFKSWIPFFQDFVNDKDLHDRSFGESASQQFSVPVADRMFASDTMKSWIFDRILAESVSNRKKYTYSDIAFYFMKEIIETITNQTLDAYVEKNFYVPMGLSHMMYKPLEKVMPNTIAPTEYDANFRKQLLQGYVHDQGAALLGGVSGHAGLFGNAQDVATIMQMLLNGGEYGGERLLQRGTIEYFTRAKSYTDKDNRRALGFDKPVEDDGPGPTFHGISGKSFGHSGFTGTFAWADPEEEIVYVFLSNRIYPSADNKKLIRMNLRSDIQQLIYEAIVDAEYQEAK